MKASDTKKREPLRPTNSFFNKRNHGGMMSSSDDAEKPFFSPRENLNSASPAQGNDFSGGQPSMDMGEEFVGGRTPGEFVGDVARPVGTVFGNIVGGVAGALGGNKISYTNVVAPTRGDHGRFNWIVRFNTTGRNGWIVQNIKNTYRAEDATGTPLPSGPTPEYWEAWAVDGTGAVTPGGVGGHDMWGRPDRGTNSQGHWSMKGKAYFTTTDPATQGFTTTSVPDANGLLATTSAPSGLGIARLHRYAQGSWDSTGTVPTHTGSAF